MEAKPLKRTTGSAKLFFWFLVGFYPWFTLRLFPGWVGGEGGWVLPKLLLLVFLGAIALPLVWRLKNEPLRLPLLAALVLVLLACLTALPHDEATYIVLGPEGRMDGLLYQVGLILFGIAFLWALSTPADWEVAEKAFLLSGSLQGILVTLQGLGLDPVAWLLRPPGGQFPFPTGTLGQPGFVAGLLLPLIPLALVRARGGQVWGWLALFALALGLGTTINRTAFLALLLGLPLWALLKRDVRLLLLGAFVIGIVFAWGTFGPKAQKYTRSYGETNTLQTRLLIWGLALETLKDPKTLLIGGGPDGFRYALITRIPIEKQLPFYKAEYRWEGQITKVEPLFNEKDPLRARTYLIHETTKTGQALHLLRHPLDKAHNAYLDKVLAYGLPMALVWFFLFIRPTLTLLLQGNALGVGLLLILIYYLTWFPAPPFEPWHLALALAGWKLSRFSPKPPPQTPTSPRV